MVGVSHPVPHTIDVADLLVLTERLEPDGAEILYCDSTADLNLLCAPSKEIKLIISIRNSIILLKSVNLKPQPLIN